MEKTYFTVSSPPNPSGVVLVFCSGGGYGNLSNLGDAPPVFELLKPYGVTLVTLGYRLPRGNSEIPLLDAQRMLRYVRYHAKEWKCDPERVGVMGLSAGGHLAAMAATCFERRESEVQRPRRTDELPSRFCHPDLSRNHDGGENPCRFTSELAGRESNTRNDSTVLDRNSGDGAHLSMFPCPRAGRQHRPPQQ